MSAEIGKLNIPTFVCFPLRQSNIPHYFKLDTLTLVLSLFGKNQKKSDYTVDKLKQQEGYLWDLFFNTQMKVFKTKGYTFAHSILTDGYGCTLLFIRSDLYNTTGRTIIKAMTKPYNYKEFIYVDELNDIQKEEYSKRKLIGIDPGKIELIYATDGNTIIEKKKVLRDNKEIIIDKHRTNTFRYTQKQVKFEQKIKIYRNNIINDKKNTIINGRTIKEIEDELSLLNSKSIDYETAKKYITKKNEINNILKDYYKKDLYRKQKWYSFINTQKSEANMINNFKQKFGSQEDVVILFGDYSEKNMYAE